jgi:hypothetical protein
MLVSPTTREEASESVVLTKPTGGNPEARTSVKQPLSPKSLAPLVIPAQQGIIPRLARQHSLSRLRSGSTPVEPSLRSARTDDSPKTRTPFTPLSATLLATPKSAATATTLPTPVSATTDVRASPKPWGENYALVSTPKENAADVNATPKAETEPRSAPPVPLGHRRGFSESGSIMERGRPRKRGEIIGLKRTTSKRSQSAERKAFETLPKGWKAIEAPKKLGDIEIASLRTQAQQQAARFEVLRKDDVESLSKVSGRHDVKDFARL